MDLDGDGIQDVVSGSWPGEIYFFRRKGAGGPFEAGRVLRDRNDKPLNVGHATTAFAVDWNGDGTMDLLAGTLKGEVYLIPNEARTGVAFGEPILMVAAGEPIKVASDAAPAAADWDGDGRLDLLVGSEDGSVVWFRNTGRPQEPKLAVPLTLIPKSPLGWGGDDNRRDGDWGVRVKISVFDWNGDGRLDLLLGDRCGGWVGKPAQDSHEAVEERAANRELPDLMAQWRTAFQKYRQLLDAPEPDGAEERASRTRQLESHRLLVSRYKDEIKIVQELQSRYRPQSQSHGFVWLFLRKPPAKPAPAVQNGAKP